VRLVDNVFIVRRWRRPRPQEGKKTEGFGNALGLRDKKIVMDEL
jgi:hypothetical protein